ncbi:MAG: hypothetical protein USCAAHI_01980 [Beijerinckiaceae bacterium]|nr:MAG: hypothetical protein USCAAHI_01980 [Beijerinckiaceae bacterium]
MVPGVERQPLKKLEPDEDQLLKLMNRWRHEALQTGHAIERVVVAYEAGHDGFWLARWLRERGVEAYVMHASSIVAACPIPSSRQNPPLRGRCDPYSFRIA